MTYRLTEEQVLLRDTIRELAHERIAPRAAEIDRTGEFPEDIRQLLAEQDVLALPYPVEHGGLGADLLTQCIAIEQIARACVTSSLILSVHALASLPLLLAGTDEQKARFFSNLASGKTLAAFALTEPEAGSDVAALSTTAKPDGRAYVRIDGEKTWISNGGIADHYVVFARSGEAPGAKGLSAFVVDAGTPGLSIAERIEVIAPHPLARLRFDNVRVPIAQRLGAPGEGFKVAMATLDIFRSTVGAAADLDYELTVLHDACADGDPEVHRILTEKVFPRQAAVLDVAAWSARVGGGG